jgi:hypothetical protein
MRALMVLVRFDVGFLVCFIFFAIAVVLFLLLRGAPSHDVWCPRSQVWLSVLRSPPDHISGLPSAAALSSWTYPMLAAEVGRLQRCYVVSMLQYVEAARQVRARVLQKWKK